MTDIERIVNLRAALQNLAESADRYVTDGSWIEHVHLDVQFAKDVLRVTRLNNVEQSISDAVGRLTTGEKNEH
jgi:hypothetical protein